MKVNVLLNNETVLFAKAELEKYLFLLDKKISDTFVVELGFMDKTDDEIDTVEVNIGKNGGTLKGSNPRSVLYAVYQYLEALGIRWVRHGHDGEYIPEGVKVEEHEVVFTHTATSKYRGTCLEGASSLEVLLTNIDWAAKMGLNAYFLQFTNPFGFMNRWYKHQRNGYRLNENLQPEDGMLFKDKVAVEVKKRGLSFHDVGHGWTSMPLGLLESDGEGDYPEEIRSKFALVNGKRSVADGAANTQLCYSNPEVRTLMAECVADYSEAHPEIDVIHFWLADGSSNYCECDACRQKRPADWYVMLLNEVDEALTKRNLDTKIVFLAYLDLLWAPLEEKIKNLDRMILMFAPIGRFYDTSYAQVGELTEEIPYELNKMHNPKDNEDNLGHLARWYKQFPVDCFSYEYYYWRAAKHHYGDFGTFNLAKIVYEDIVSMKKYNVLGVVSCQAQRAFMPNGFGQYVMCKAMWDEKISFEQMTDDYFEAAFGSLAEDFKGYFMRQSANSKVVIHRTEEMSLAIKHEAENMLAFLKEKQDEINALPFAKRKSVFYAQFHMEMLIKYMTAEAATKETYYEENRDKWVDLARFVYINEPEMQMAFDVELFMKDLAVIHPELKKFPEMGMVPGVVAELIPD
ncbi:MAG: DUF4838 domain-containing protein [Clostridia bacterium]|nr:DUF4838 domain-containing protein [Clostridia bacterium]